MIKADAGLRSANVTIGFFDILEGIRDLWCDGGFSWSKKSLPTTLFKLL